VNDITLCMAYYLNAGMLRLQYQRLQSMPADIARHLSLSLVDDGSPRDPAWLEPVGRGAVLHRITVDVRWNQDAARNLAARFAPAPWLLLTDMDHLVPVETWRALLTQRLDRACAYRFARVNYPGHDPYKPHPNTWLLPARTFEAMGGYDERFAGFYGTDADFAQRLGMIARITMLPQVVERVPREVIPDASTTTYARKTPADKDGIITMKLQRGREQPVRTLRYRFPFVKVDQWPSDPA